MRLADASGSPEEDADAFTKLGWRENEREPVEASFVTNESRRRGNGDVVEAAT